MSSHRQSFSQDLRHPPASPRLHRHSVQDLLNNPPVANKTPSLFANRDWRTVLIGEIVDPSLVHWVEEDASVEDATKLLISAGSPNAILVRKNKASTEFTTTFDYSDLNAYLLLAIGITKPTDAISATIPQRASEGQPIPLKDTFNTTPNKEHVTLSNTAKLTQAVEIFGSGVHRIIVTEEGTRNVVGLLTQLRLVKFFWEQGRNFEAVEKVFPASLKDLGIGSRSVISINGDKPVKEALDLMNKESITSLPVLDSQRNVVGNISHVDVRLLTTTASLPLLTSSCIHFISVILSERGMNDGKDSYPVFYVSPYSTLAHTVAKLVATVSHRMWVVDAPSPSSSAPPTPSHTTSFQPQALHAHPTTMGPPYTSSLASTPSASLPGQHMSGRLSGVVSLTDVLNIFARASGLNPTDPSEARRRRRRSSSSSVRASIDSVRSSFSLDSSARPGASSLPKR